MIKEKKSKEYYVCAVKMLELLESVENESQPAEFECEGASGCRDRRRRSPLQSIHLIKKQICTVHTHR